MSARIPINLASEPFRRDRAMLLSTIALSIVLAIGLFGQTYLVVMERTRAQEARIAVEREERTLAAL